MVQKNILSVLFVGLIMIPFLHGQSMDESELDTTKNRLNVFIDCRTYCDFSYFKSQINYINYVRDPALADVHILITRYPLANNGNQYTFNLIGKNSFENIKNVFTQDVPPNTPRDNLRKILVRYIQLGLVAYLVHSNLEMDLSVNENQDIIQAPVQEQDPWNYWVFEVYAGGSLSKESKRRTFRLNNGIEIDRVTEEWRISQDIYFRGTYQKIFQEDQEDIISNLRRFGLSGRVVKSLGDHWSAGLFESYNASTFSNIKLGVRVGPAIEYSIFPYQEVVNREFTIAYHFGYNTRNYFEETLFGKLKENLWDQSLRISLRLRQPWGSVFSSLRGKHFLGDFSKNNVELDNSISFRLIKGLSLDIRANFELINDQLAIPKGEATLEEVLLQQKQLASDYDLYLSLGFRYNFGSNFNNIVNTRL